MSMALSHSGRSPSYSSLVSQATSAQATGCSSRPLRTFSLTMCQIMVSLKHRQILWIVLRCERQWTEMRCPDDLAVKPSVEGVHVSRFHQYDVAWVNCPDRFREPNVMSSSPVLGSHMRVKESRLPSALANSVSLL